MVYTGARIVNYLLNGKDGVHWDKPFSIVVNGREFVTRSVPGDIYHLIKDPGSFANHRLNPTTIRTAIVALQHRSATGKWMSPKDQLTDFFSRHKPIPFQKAADQTWYQAFLNSAGVTDIENRSVALQEALKIRARTPFSQPTKAMEEKSKDVIKYVKDLHKAKSPEEKKSIMDKLSHEVAEKKLNQKDLKKIFTQASYSDLQRAIKPMAIEEALYIWQLGSDEEKMSIGPILMKKVPKLAADRRESLKEPLSQFFLDYKNLSKAQKKAKDKPVIDRLRELTGRKAAE
jgi:hypothetical protein